MKTKPLKGSIGYINHIKKESLMFGFAGLTVFIVIYLSGIALTNTNKNYGTILAVLIALPTAQMFTRYLGYYRYRSVAMEVVEALSDYRNLSKLYEMLVIRGKVNFYVDAILVSNDQILLLAMNSKGLKQDNRKTRQELQTLMNHKGIKVNTELFETIDELKSYIESNNLDGFVTDEKQHELIVRAFLGSAM